MAECTYRDLDAAGNCRCGCGFNSDDHYAYGGGAEETAEYMKQYDLPPFVDIFDGPPDGSRTIKQVVRGQVADSDRGDEMTNQHSQPMPIPNDHPSVQSAVRDDLLRREALGKQKYGTALQPHNGRNALLDAYEEALDLVCYLKQALLEMEN